jgi:hypothetical protein
MRTFKNWLSLISVCFLLCSSIMILIPGRVLAEEGITRELSPYETIVTDENGNQLVRAIYPLTPPKIKIAVAEVPNKHIEGATNTLSNVPAFDWSYGCSATSAAMLFGYYDCIGYSSIYTGPANGGVCPQDNSVWGTGESPLSATHQGIDGRPNKGHVDDYWVDVYSTEPDPYITGDWDEHTPLDCAGDYMGTNQYKYENTDGGTSFYYNPNGDPLYDYTGCEPADRDGCHGMRLFAEFLGYTVVTNYHQLIQGTQGTESNKGFTFANYQAEIDAGRPVLIHVVGHTMIGWGYDTAENKILLHDTWDHNDHDMVWGGAYPYGASSLQHRAVTVLQLSPILTMEPIVELQDGYYGTAPVFSNFGFSDANGLDDGWYQIDTLSSDNWTALFTDAPDTVWDDDGWSIPTDNFTALDQGPHTIYFMVSNDVGEVEGESGEWGWQFFKDITPPTKVSGLTSTSHTLGVWSNNSAITANWTAADDTLSGIAGYSVLWDTDNTTVPSPIKNTDNVTTITSQALPTLPDSTDNYTFHIRAVDRAGNWGEAVHLGPFRIDTTIPTGPSGLTTSHPVSTFSRWSDNHTVTANWTAGGDGHSGLKGYSFVWDTTANTQPDSVIDTVNPSAVSDNLADGTHHYFHVRAVDNAGNAGTVLHRGPFFIAVYSPKLTGGSVSPTTGYPDTKFTFSVTYTHTDNQSFDYVAISIDGDAPVNMVPDGSTDYDTGVAFSIDITSLTTGNHVFAFSGSDNTSNAAFCEIDQYPGPAVTQKPAPPPSGGGGGGGGGAPGGPGVTAITPYTNADGKFNLAAAVKSQDENVKLAIAQGVLARTKDDTPLKSIKVVPIDNPATTLPEGYEFIGLVYELTPEGATFTPSITMTLFYDKETLPEKTDENTIKILVYNRAASKWELLESVVNKTDSSVSTDLGHFSVYTLAGKKAVPPTTKPAPVLSPARFSLSELAVKPVEVKPRETVTISAKVSNSGETKGNYGVTLKINGAVEVIKTVSLAAGENTIIDFTVNISEPGKYEVDVNGASATFTVQRIEQPTPTNFNLGGPPPDKHGFNWVVLWIILGTVVLVAAVITTILVVRSKHRTPSQRTE